MTLSEYWIYFYNYLSGMILNSLLIIPLVSAVNINGDSE